VSQAYRIDVHHHMVTENHPLYQMPEGLTWWSASDALRVMDDNQIAAAVLLPGIHLPQHMTLIKLMMSMRDGPFGGTRPVRTLIRKAIRAGNQEVAKAVSANPDRFGFFAYAGLLHADDAVREAVYALDTLGADGVFLPTNVGPVYLGDDAFEPLLSELDRRAAVVFVHPMNLPCPAISGFPAHTADFLLSTVRAATNLVQKGATRRYRRLRFILAHAGGFIPYAVQRLAHVLATADPARTKEDLTAEYRTFYFDVALSTAPATVAALLAFADPNHVLYGSDFPFVQPADVAFFTAQFDHAELGASLRQAVNRDNAAALFPRLVRPDRLADCGVSRTGPATP
jgi:6-methylsalicylate decarboxylase